MAPQTGYHPDDLKLTSGFKQYPKRRDESIKNPELWLKGKREVDDVFPYWRIHDKLYDMETFIFKHPGGSFWIESTKGTDITELFESSHLEAHVETILEKYYVKTISVPRNSPYTFYDDGFYQTLKRKAIPILKEVGRGPSKKMKMIQDSLLFFFLVFALLASSYSSIYIAILSGMFLGLAAIAAHNFFHQKDNWRMYIFDLMLLSSREWRISHAFSHHVFPNTIYDYEISAFEPHFQFLPRSSKTFMDRYVIVATTYLIFLVSFFLDSFNRIILIYRKEITIHKENCLPFIELIAMILFNGSLSTGFGLWIVLHCSANMIFLILGLWGAHHHPDNYHEGDALPQEEKDWGVHQIVATRDKSENLSNLFLTSISFGHHALHHMFPTVDHSKLQHLWPVFLETCKEFNIEYNCQTFWQQIRGFYQQLASVLPNHNEPTCLNQKRA